MSYQYDTEFFDFVNASAGRSADRFIACLLNVVFSDTIPGSVLDVGCGRGIWLAMWKEQGVKNIQGVDGDYVGRNTLLIPEDSFLAANIATPLYLEERFELVQCLEVAEHIPSATAETLVDNLVRHGDVILFSAAIPGQGGEFHVNEQHYSYWKEKFEARGYFMYDAIRSAVRSLEEIEPWYRYNSFIYANDSGRGRLAPETMETFVPIGDPVPSVAPFLWRMRCFLFYPLPPGVISKLARMKHRIMNLLRTNRR